jgi:ubiquinone/menaquinone biosynthesis C-methylase UbiE
MIAAMEGWQGWDDYAPFYDWENAQTVQRRDIAFWSRLVRHSLAHLPASRRRVLELGCGTGRVTLPLARAGATMVGIDRSAEMLARAEQRVRRRRSGGPLHLIRGDIRHLPFAEATFPLVIAPYGILQSLLDERDLAATLNAVVRVLQPGSVFGLELVADLPEWKEYTKRPSLRGRRANGTRIALIETVRQDRARQLTIFEQEFVERQGREVRRKRFTLSFRTLTVREMASRLEKAGLTVTALLGDYRGGPWDERAEAWIVLAQKR